MWWHLCLIQSSTALFSFYLLEFSSIFIQFIAVHLKWIKMCRSYDHRAQIYNTSSLELFPYLLLCIGFKAMFSTQTGQWGVYSRPAVLSQWQQTLMTYKIEREREMWHVPHLNWDYLIHTKEEIREQRNTIETFLFFVWVSPRLWPPSVKLLLINNVCFLRGTASPRLKGLCSTEIGLLSLMWNSSTQYILSSIPSNCFKNTLPEWKVKKCTLNTKAFGWKIERNMTDISKYTDGRKMLRT